MSEEQRKQLLLQIIGPFQLFGISPEFRDLGHSKAKIKIPLIVGSVSPMEHELCNIEDCEDLDPELGPQNARCLIGEFYSTPQRIPVKVFVKQADNVNYYKIITN